jgi:hypothetical protein
MSYITGIIWCGNMNIKSNINEVQTTLSVNVKSAVGIPFYDCSCEYT